MFKKTDIIKAFLILCAILLGGTLFAQPEDAAATAVLSPPDKPVLKSVKSTAVKTLTVKWGAVADADGYDIRYVVGKKTRTKTVTPGSLRSYKLKNLLGGKKYKVKIRSFREEKGKKLCSGWSKVKSARVKRSKWSDLQDKFSADNKVKTLIFVKYAKGSKAELILYCKTKENNWKKVLACNAYTGRYGIDKKREGDRRTPTGVYTLTHAFGVKKDPGSVMKYIKLNKYLYWCGDREHYNQLVDIRQHPHSCRGEHLIDYTKQYAYAMALDYNRSHTYGKGSAIFLHCYGYNPYTLGCIAVSEDNMKTILRTCENNTKICIYKK